MPEPQQIPSQPVGKLIPIQAQVPSGPVGQLRPVEGQVPRAPVGQLRPVQQDKGAQKFPKFEQPEQQDLLDKSYRFAKTVGQDVVGAAQGLGGALKQSAQMFDTGIESGQPHFNQVASQQAAELNQRDQWRQQQGYSPLYRGAAAIGSTTGVANPVASEEAAQRGDTQGVIAHQVVPAAFAALGARDAVTRGGEVPREPVGSLRPVEETQSTPQPIKAGVRAEQPSNPLSTTQPVDQTLQSIERLRAKMASGPTQSPNISREGGGRPSSEAGGQMGASSVGGQHSMAPSDAEIRVQKATAVGQKTEAQATAPAVLPERPTTAPVVPQPRPETPVAVGAAPQATAAIPRPQEPPKLSVPKQDIKAWPDRTIGQQPKDLPELIKRQVAEGKLTKGQAADLLAKHFNQEAKPGSTFRYSDLDANERQKLETIGARTTAPKEAPATAARQSTPEPVQPAPAAKEPVREPAGVTEGVAKAPESPKASTSPGYTGESLSNKEARIRAQAGDKADQLNTLKSAVQKMATKSGQDFSKAWDQALSRYEKQLKNPLTEPPKPKDPSQAGFVQIGGKKTAVSPAAHIKDYIEDEITRNDQARRLSTGLDDLASASTADVIRAKKAIKETEGSREDHEAIYHWLEDQSLPLTGKQGQILAKEVLPLLKENARIVNKLTDTGARTEDYVHRIALKKNSATERVLLGRSQFSPGAVLSKGADTFKGRKYQSLEHPEIQGKLVVSERQGQVVAHLNGIEHQLGTREQLTQTGGKFATATTKAIEQHTPTSYLKHALGNTIISHAELRRAERAHDFLEAYKDTQDFKDATFKPQANGDKVPPKGWRLVGPQDQRAPMKGIYFEPHTAEVLNRYYERLNKGEPGVFEKLNQHLTRSIFFNPLLHSPNMLTHWIVEKGTRGWLPDQWKSIAETGIKAIDIVMHPERGEYAKMLEEGAPLQSQRGSSREMTTLLASKVYSDLSGKPSLAKRLSDTLGFAHPAQLLKTVYDFSNKTTWLADDIFRVQAALQRSKGEGIPLSTAIKDVSRHMPDYRLPTRILNSPELAKLMSNPNISMFGAYHYGALKSYGEMLKEMVGRDKSLTATDRAKSFNRLAMLGIVTYLIYPALDQLARKSTGDEKAYMRRAGASTFVYNLQKVLQGKKGLYPAATSVVTPAPLLGLGIKASQNLIKPEPLGKQVGTLTKDITGELGPVSAANQARPGSKGDIDWKRFFWSALGVRHETQKAASAKGGPRGPSVPRVR